MSIIGWKNINDFVGVMFMPKDKLFTYKIDGFNKIDGKEADYETTGLYTKILDASPDARTMEMEMKNGQKAKFTLKPNKNQIKLVFINNKTSYLQYLYQKRLFYSSC